MARRLITLALIAALAAVFLPALAAADYYYGTMYVYTDNGKGLNVRRDPYTGNNIIGSLNFGDEVTVVEITSSGWAQILWEEGYYGEYSAAYVQSRFLVSYNPGSGPAQPIPAPVWDDTDDAGAFSAMNAEFVTGKKVSPYTVTARPSRASGWVNLRWAPSTEAERIATCRQGKKLTVLAELKNWYQVQDPETGMIGFIMRQYVTRK